MCKLFRRIVKWIAPTSTRPHNYDDDTSRRDRDVVSVSAPCPPRKQRVNSTTAMTPEPSVRGTSCPIFQIPSEEDPSCSLSESKIPRNVREPVDIEQDSAKHWKISTTSADDRGPVYPKEKGWTDMKDELGPHKEKHQYQCHGNRVDDGQDVPCGTHFSSSKENTDIYRPPLAHVNCVEPISPASAGLQHLHEAQSKELGVLQHERRVAFEEKKALADAYASLKRQYEERSKKLSVARHERQAAVAQKKEIDGAYAALKQQYEEQTKELDAARQERQTALEQKQRAEENHSSLRQKYDSQRSAYSTLRNKYLSLKATLEQRTSELQGIQKFFATADTFSGSEIVNTLRKLNEEVQQSATFMVEWAIGNFTFETPTTDQATEQTRTSEALATRLMGLLAARKHKDNPILMEMAFRAYLTYELYWIASPWSIGQEEHSHNMYIDAIYQRMRDTEGQAISGNWRALTRAYTLPACISDPELAQTIDTTIISGFADILSVAGCATPKSDVTSAFWEKFAEKVHHLVSLAGQISKIIGVGVISEDFEVLVVSPDAVFDDKTMEDSYDNGDRNQGTEEHKATVLCATELGLMQRMRVGADTGEEGKSPELIVIKPKVALASVVNIIDE